MDGEKIVKKRGRPAGIMSKKQRLLRVIITPRQDRLLNKLKIEWGLSESEHVRRAIDIYLDSLIARGDIADD